MLDGNDRYEPLCGGSDQVPISPCDAPRTSAPPPRSPDCHSRNSSSCASAWPACLHLGVTVTVHSGQLVWSIGIVKTPFWSARSQCSGCCSALRLDHSGVNFSLIKLTPERDCHCPALCPCASPLASRDSPPILTPLIPCCWVVVEEPSTDPLNPRARPYVQVLEVRRLACAT